MRRREILRALAARWAASESAATGGPDAADLDLEPMDRPPARS